jgi:hypothetical protein
MCEIYNGYENRETWATALWLNNDEGLGESFRDYLEVHCEDRMNDETQPRWWKEDSQATQYATQWAEIWLDPDGYAFEFGDDWPIDLARIASDIGSLYRVNWGDVMDAVLSDN